MKLDSIEKCFKYKEMIMLEKFIENLNSPPPTIDDVFLSKLEKIENSEELGHNRGYPGQGKQPAVLIYRGTQLAN